MSTPETSPPLVLEHGPLRAAIAVRGAELQSLRHAGREHLWHGDPAWWPWRAPLLFPVIGRLEHDRYLHRGVTWPMAKHGFARELDFEVVAAGATAATLALHESPSTRAVYPFRFHLTVTWRLAADHLAMGIEVANPGDEPLLFSLGLHPAFRWPLVDGEDPEAYAVELAEEETADRWPLADGLLTGPPEPVLRGARRLPLRPGLFARDALVFKSLRSRHARLVSSVSGRGVELAFPGFPYFGLWTRPGAPYLCLEPWCGVADTAGAGGELARKEGIVSLPPGESWRREATFRPL